MKKLLLAVAVLAALLDAPAAAQRRIGSIYNPDRGPYGLVANRTARQVGDLVTILIRESTDVANEESTGLNRATNLNYRLNVFDIKPNTFSTLPRVDADSTDGFTGSASYNKTGTFSARISAVVMDTLPNGNLVIAGRRELHVDDETKLIEFTGIVRRYDIQQDNTVESELVANAEVTYRGSGPLTRTTKRYGIGGWFHRLWGWLWPF
jgi:flagellar L-ring protein precursor FlgH